MSGQRGSASNARAQKNSAPRSIPVVKGKLPLPDVTNPTFQSELELLKYYREEIRHEFNLLGSRVSSYLTSQSFLVVSYVTAMVNTATWGRNYAIIFALLLCGLGGALSWRATNGIDGACEIIKKWLAQQNLLFHDSPVNSPEVTHPNLVAFHINRLKSKEKGDDNESPTTHADEIHDRSLKFSKLAPRIFGVAWGSFACLSIVNYFHLLDHIGIWQ